MSPLQQILSSGISPEKILEYLGRKSNVLGARIAKALASGMSAEKIVSFLSKGQNFDKVREQIQSEYSLENNANPLIQAENIRSQNLGTDLASSMQRSAKPLLKTAGTLAASYAMGRAIPAMLQGASDLFNQRRTDTETQIPDQNIDGTQQPPINTGSISQPTENNQLLDDKINEIIQENQGFVQKIQDLTSAGNTPDIVAAYFKTYTPSQIKKLEKQTGKSIEELVDYVLKKFPVQDLEQKQKEIIPEPSVGKQSEPQIPKIESAQEPVKVEEVKQPAIHKLEKGALTASPSGLGTIVEIRNGTALIEVDGKIKKFKEEDLIQSPLPEKQLGELYRDVIGLIESETGQQVSRNVDWAGYDPSVNELAYKPHGSDKLYIYDNISAEDVKTLSGFLTQRKTTGQNFIGAWEAGSKSPIGAAMYQLIKKLQQERGGKGSEYRSRYDTIYDALEPAKLALKNLYAEEKRKNKKAKKPRPS